MTRPAFIRRTALRRERGVVLIMSLVLLIAISLVAAIAIRSAISGEQVSKALRTHTAASQAAELALRYCEDQILRNGRVMSGGVARTPHPYPTDGTAPAIWSDRANWAIGAGKAIAIDPAVIQGADAATRALPVPPRCMVEALRLNPMPGARGEAFLVTAVGFSADYRVDGAGKPQAGGEVWLQSTLKP